MASVLQCICVCVRLWICLMSFDAVCELLCVMYDVLCVFVAFACLLIVFVWFVCDLLCDGVWFVCLSLLCFL